MKSCLQRSSIRKVERNMKSLNLVTKKLQKQIAETDERYGVQIKTLQETLQAQEEKDRELTNVKEAFNGLSLEVNSSRKKMDELELELQTSAGESLKFEELHKEIGLHAESETKRALEFKRLLEFAESSAKEMEDQMACVQLELKSLYEKIAENQKVEEALKNTTAKLSTVQGELDLSKSKCKKWSRG
ncbi:Prefoldin [Abeliophyllum distichum]|uniref:Prefoldin n=1 Tax=Abeliophyllum distichum TaxID=126358 RepID=A0ABD1SD87_9LAMI